MTTDRDTKAAIGIKLVIKLIIAAVILYFVVIFGLIYKNLTKFGYSMSELPETIKVYYGASEGFTVEEGEDGETTFIGRHDYIYTDVVKGSGWNFDEKINNIYQYSRKDSYKILWITETIYDCHFFRVYTIKEGKIEDFIKE